MIGTLKAQRERESEAVGGLRVWWDADRRKHFGEVFNVVLGWALVAAIIATLAAFVVFDLTH